MSRKKYMPGDVQGRLTLRETHLKKNKKGLSFRVWICDCSCGNRREMRESSLYQGAVSCRCFHKECVGNRFRKHGDTVATGGCSSEYETWGHMKARCNNPNNKNYAGYGGRGITVCPQWNDDFSAFLADVGRKPSPKYSLDRIDVNKGYSPENVRWATQREQTRNTRKNILITIDGATKSIPDWADVSGISAQVIRHRFHKGWDHRLAVFTPVKTQRKAQ